MGFMRGLLPKPKSRLIPLTLAFGCIFWALLYFGSPGRSFNLPGEEFLHHRYPPAPRPHDHNPRPLPHTIWNTRAEQVKQAFLHAYRGYNEYAASHDELMPVTNRFHDNFNGWGLTLIDALDTMWIMDLREEFYDALPLVANMTFVSTKAPFVPFFETVIRYLGGLLSAYALSNEPLLLTRADDLGKALLPAFNTTSGMPMFAVNTATGETRSGWAGGAVLWSEALSCQMEYKYLARLTGRPQYYEKVKSMHRCEQGNLSHKQVEHVMNIMRDANVTDGMFPTRWAVANAIPINEQFSVGAFADSAHEYLLKQWLLSSRTETKAKDLLSRHARRERHPKPSPLPHAKTQPSVRH
ncbi:hypothetical protein NM688_g8069 [Phlebia brevispora]|uniref:Uncharacterized protein n=1 Tax=Phlebia brevispora TaxID=194682 RepID=A0ACC1RXP9_9APHY|nr:hypothetical protein NM688_g8069 [Phlebia brevispora]